MLLEAVWLFMGRYSPMVSIEPCGPRSDPQVVERLVGLRSESGMDHDVRWTFERVTHVARPVTVGGYG